MAKVTQLYESIEPVTGKREAILNAALQLFTEYGFHGTAMLSYSCVTFAIKFIAMIS